MIQLIECVPNISEGRDSNIIRQITDQVETVDGVRLLDVDPGKATNRTVITFVGEPEAVIEAAFRLMKKAKEMIDMSRHSGEHPRFGATDVCPLIPITNIEMDEVAEYARKLGKRVGEELDYPVYLYESAASRPERKNLATVRSGEYEGLSKKLADSEWKPDFGPAEFRPRTGATAISARNFLVAVNFNLNTTSVRRANSVAFDVREAGRVQRQGDPITGEVVTDSNGEPVRESGKLKACKAIGWYIEEYGIAQISMNLTDISVTSVHEAFDAVSESAEARGMRVTGTEIVGLVPLKVMLEAGRHFLRKQQRSTGVSDNELIKIAIKTMGLDELRPFDPEKKVIEFFLRDATDSPLVNMKLNDFAELTSSESPAPGGGSVAAYVGTLGVSLGGMVANLSSHKRGWDDRWEYFSKYAEEASGIQKELLRLVDEDTKAFNRIMEAFGMSKSSEADITERKKAIQQATKYAIEIPLRVMEVALSGFGLLEKMVEEGNPNSITDAAVGVLCARTAVRGAYLNVKVNTGGYGDKEFVSQKMAEADKILAEAKEREDKVWERVNAEIA